MTVYDREDRDLLRLPYTEPRVVDGVFVATGSLTSHYRQRARRPRARRRVADPAAGAERLRRLGVIRSGSRPTAIALTNEEFWGDYDQRHTVNLMARIA